MKIEIEFDDNQTSGSSPPSDNASAAAHVDEAERLAAALMEALARRQAASLAAKATSGVDAALNQLGSRLSPPLRAAVRDVLLGGVSPATFEQSDQGRAAADEHAQTPDDHGDCDDFRSDAPPFQRPTKTRLRPADEMRFLPLKGPQMQTPKRKRVAIRPTQLTAKWIPVYRTSLTKEQRKTFVPLIALANARGLAPSDIVDAHITDFIAHMAAKGCNNPTSFARSAVTTWNAVAVAAPELGLKRLTPILTPHQLREQTLDGLAAPVCVAIKGFLDSNPDDVPQTRQTRANHIHYLCLSLIAQGRPPRTPADLISEASIDLLIDDPRFGGDEAVSRYRHSILNTLRQFARFIGNAARAKAIKAVQATELPKIPQAVAVGTVVKLLRFDDPDELVSLIARCAGFVRALAVTTNRRCDVAAAQDGLAVILIIETMAMREDMQDLSFDGEPRATAFGDRPTLVTPDRSAFEKKLKPNAIGLIDEYFVYATKALKRPPLWLFERLWGGRRDPSSVGRGVRIAASTPQARLTWTDLRDLSVKIAAARGHSAATIAPDAGYTLTVNFLARFDALINANVSQEFADLVLGPDFDEADCDEDEEGGDEEENCDEEQDCDV